MRSVLFMCFLWSVLAVQAQEKPALSKEDRKVLRQVERAQRKQVKDSARVNRVILIPALFYTPETRVALGLSTLALFKTQRYDTLTKYSQALLAGIYTQNDQLIVIAPSQIFLKENKYFLVSELSFFRYPYVFAGIGNDHEIDDTEQYSSNFSRIDIGALRQVKGSFYAGLRFFYQNVDMQERAVGGRLETDTVLGSNGGINSGLGLFLMYDTRDNSLAPQRGVFLRHSSIRNASYFGSEFEYDSHIFDGRAYVPFLRTSTLAFNLYTEFNPGDVPFYRMAQLGGQYRMRGYQQGIYRDHDMWVNQLEYRSPLFLRWFAFTLFGGIGGVGNGLDEINENWRYTYGAGIRFALDAEKRMYLRFDGGFGEETSGFYLSVGEAF